MRHGVTGHRAMTDLDALNIAAADLWLEVPCDRCGAAVGQPCPDLPQAHAVRRQRYGWVKQDPQRWA